MSTRHPSILDAINLEHAQEFSYYGHHTEAIDYLCLFRSEYVTLKAYFFDNDSADNIVLPHTHRYDFQTYVVCGGLVEARFFTDKTRARDLQFKQLYYSPIVEGDGGFTETGDWNRLRMEETGYNAGDSYYNRAHKDIHTLREVQAGTVLILTQFADVGSYVTKAWCPINTALPEFKAPTRMSNAKIKQRIENLQAAFNHGSYK